MSLEQPPTFIHTGSAERLILDEERSVAELEALREVSHTKFRAVHSLIRL